MKSIFRYKSSFYLKKDFLQSSGLLTIRNERTSSSSVESVTSPRREIKPFKEMPSIQASTLTKLRGLIANRKEGHANLQTLYQQLGGVFKDTMLGVTFVYVGDKEELRKLHSYDGKTPQRLVLPLWERWREKNGYTRGILISRYTLSSPKL